MLVYTRQKNIAQVFILERYFFDVYILASRIRLRKNLQLADIKPRKRLQKRAFEALASAKIYVSASRGHA